MRRVIINSKDRKLIVDTLNEIIDFIGENPTFFAMKWDWTKVKTPKQMDVEGGDYFPRLLIIKETRYLLQVEETWGGGVNIIFEPCKARPGKILRDSVVNQCFVRPKFTWTEYLAFAKGCHPTKDMSAVACGAMGVDY